MTVQETDHKRIKISPIFIYLGFLAVGFIAEYFVPTKLVDKSWAELLGYAFPVLGLVINFYAGKQFSEAGTSVFHFKPTTKLVQTGIFHLSRNPIYVGLTLIYLGIGFALNNLWIIGLVVALVPLMNWAVIKPEEEFLEEKFGDAYRHYKYHVRRWL